jgi:hypothetical protein
MVLLSFEEVVQAEVLLQPQAPSGMAQASGEEGRGREGEGGGSADGGAAGQAPWLVLVPTPSRARATVCTRCATLRGCFCVERGVGKGGRR